METLFIMDKELNDLTIEQQRALSTIIKAFNGTIKFNQPVDVILDYIEGLEE